MTLAPHSSFLEPGAKKYIVHAIFWLLSSIAVISFSIAILNLKQLSQPYSIKRSALKACRYLFSQTFMISCFSVIPIKQHAWILLKRTCKMFKIVNQLFIQICRKDLDTIFKKKVCTSVALRLASCFEKNIRFAFRFCGINHFAFYSTVENIFSKILAFSKCCFKAGLLPFERTRHMLSLYFLTNKIL